MPERAKTRELNAINKHVLSTALGDTDFFETSGGELQNEAHAPDHKWLSVARQLRRDIISARDEQQKCLRRIYSSLRIYQLYLASLEQESRSITNAVDIKLGTTRLLHLIKETGNVNEEKVHPTNLLKLTDTVWNQKITTHSVLYHFADFMTDVSRAINFMKMKKLTKQEEWISKHQQ
ncbi:Interleukin-6 [Bagarius yarrelli]|uniref:Interleukin-6 n=1 Tax=Bagarius yarrelli TaxID=175774 RepID=A0A556UFJ2_BAGYA|nr:Interleukin-6 [Bagarius yarrelli]